MAAVVYRSYNLWELLCVRVAVWASCSVGELWCVAVIVWGSMGESLYVGVKVVTKA